MLELLIVLAFGFFGSLLVALLWMAVEALAPLFLGSGLGAPRFRAGLFWCVFAIWFMAWIVNLWRGVL